MSAEEYEWQYSIDPRAHWTSLVGYVFKLKPWEMDDLTPPEFEDVMDSARRYAASASQEGGDG